MTSGAAPRRFACTRESHQLSKASRASFLRDTRPLGFLPDGDGGLLEIANCKLCGSTLSLEADHDARDAAESYARREWKAEHE